MFKDLSELSLTPNWFNIKNDLQFTYDLVTSVLLFYLIYLFQIQRTKFYKSIENSKTQSSSISKFILAKKWIATALVPILLIIAVYSFLSWSIDVFQPSEINPISFKNINNIFFEQFFNILIIADVILLLFSFFHTDEFHKVIRNSGFIISTILIRISFSVSGIINNVLIVSAIGLLAGLIFTPLLIVSSGGLAVLMLLGLITRIKSNDNFLVSSPAIFYLILNSYILYLGINQ